MKEKSMESDKMNTTPSVSRTPWEEVHTPTAREKLISKSKETPFVPIGIAGTLATLAYGVYAYKNRGPMSTSRYIMKFRVLAQGAIVGAMIIGATLSTRSR